MLKVAMCIRVTIAAAIIEKAKASSIADSRMSCSTGAIDGPTINSQMPGAMAREAFQPHGVGIAIVLTATGFSSAGEVKILRIRAIKKRTKKAPAITGSAMRIIRVIGRKMVKQRNATGLRILKIEE